MSNNIRYHYSILGQTSTEACETLLFDKHISSRKIVNVFGSGVGKSVFCREVLQFLNASGKSAIFVRCNNSFFSEIIKIIHFICFDKSLSKTFLFVSQKSIKNTLLWYLVPKKMWSLFLFLEIYEPNVQIKKSIINFRLNCRRISDDKMLNVLLSKNIWKIRDINNYLRGVNNE